MSKYYVAYTSTGAVTTRYDSGINAVQIANPPAGITLLEVPDRATMISTSAGGWSVVAGVLIPPLALTSAQILAQAQAAQNTTLTASYNAAITQSVAYMSTTFQADAGSVTKLMQVLAAMTPAGATPAGFYWVDAANNHVAMTLAQVQGLAQAIMTQGWTAFTNLQNKKASVASATTVSAVQAIVF